MRDDDVILDTISEFCRNIKNESRYRSSGTVEPDMGEDEDESNVRDKSILKKKKDSDMMDVEDDDNDSSGENGVKDEAMSTGNR